MPTHGCGTLDLVNRALRGGNVSWVSYRVTVGDSTVSVETFKKPSMWSGWI